MNSTQQARELLKLDEQFSLNELKYAYKKSILANHPDRGGCNETTQRLNKAYTLLAPYASLGTSAQDLHDEWFQKLNELHPLHSNNLPSTSSFQSLLKDQFNITDDMTPALLESLLVNQNNRDWPTLEQFRSDETLFKGLGYYFQAESADYHVFGDHFHLQYFILKDITTCGRRGETFSTTKVACLKYGPQYAESSQTIFNVMRDWFSEDVSLHWLYTQLIQAINSKAERLNDIKIDHEFQPTADWGQTLTTTTLKLTKDGTEVGITIHTNKAHGEFNPFTINDIYKPLSNLPTKPTKRDLIRILVNGQYYKLKRLYEITDDSLWDKNVRDNTRYINNPLSLIAELTEASRSNSNFRVRYSHEAGIMRFGTSNASYELILNLDNAFPLVDLNYQTSALPTTPILNIERC